MPAGVEIIVIGAAAQRESSQMYSRIALSYASERASDWCWWWTIEYRMP